MVNSSTPILVNNSEPFDNLDAIEAALDPIDGSLDVEKAIPLCVPGNLYEANCSPKLPWRARRRRRPLLVLRDIPVGSVLSVWLYGQNEKAKMPKPMIARYGRCAGQEGVLRSWCALLARVREANLGSALSLFLVILESRLGTVRNSHHI